MPAHREAQTLFKRCNGCGVWKMRLEEFPPPARGRHAVGARCLACGVRYRRAYYAANRDAKIAAGKAQHQRERHDPAYRARKAAAARRQRERNPEAARAAVRRANKAHAERDPEWARATTRRRHDARRAREREAFVEHVDPLVVLERHDGTCGVCGGDVDPLDFHVEHRVPLARGGEHSYANTQPAHPLCNARKGIS